MRPQSDFFIGIKADTDFAMLDFRMRLQISHRPYYFGYSRLVVSAKQGVSVGHNQVFTYMVEQFGELFGRQDNPFFLTQWYILAPIISHDTWIHILARHIRTGIHVGNETDCRNFAVDIGRKCSEEITVFVKRYIL